jgi:hypothetical protein
VSHVTVEAQDDDEALNHFFNQRKIQPELRDWKIIEVQFAGAAKSRPLRRLRRLITALRS